MSDLLIAAPLRIEAALISSAARGVRVRKTGMGPAHARAASGALAREGAGGLLVLGFCGGLDETSVPGEVIVAEEVYAVEDQARPAARVPCTHTGELLVALAGRGMKVRSGKIVCVSRLALGEQRVRLREGGAIAVDMESAWLASAASERGPFAVVRVVLDSPKHELLRPQAVVGAVRAARALRRVAAALHEWTPGF